MSGLLITPSIVAITLTLIACTLEFLLRVSGGDGQLETSRCCIRSSDQYVCFFMLRYVFVREPVMFNDNKRVERLLMSHDHAHICRKSSERASHSLPPNMFPIHVLDRYYLAITALITVAWQLAGFFVAWTLQVRP